MGRPKNTYDLPETVTASTLYELTGLDANAVNYLRKKEVIAPLEYGLWDLKSTIRALLEMGSGDTKEKLEKQRLYNLERDGEKKEIEVGKMRGELVEREKVREDVVVVTRATQAGLRRLESSLPPQLVGLGEAAIQKRIGVATDEMLSDLSDILSPLYQPLDIPEPAKVPVAKKKVAVKRGRKNL